MLTFSKGALASYSVLASDVSMKAHTCSYSGGRLIAGRASTDCPAYESLKKGILTLPLDQEPPVPQSKDPRKNNRGQTTIICKAFAAIVGGFRSPPHPLLQPGEPSRIAAVRPLGSPAATNLTLRGPAPLR
jgi:hypothetical protein